MLIIIATVCGDTDSMISFANCNCYLLRSCFTWKAPVGIKETNNNGLGKISLRNTGSNFNSYKYTSELDF